MPKQEALSAKSNDNNARKEKPAKQKKAVL